MTCLLPELMSSLTLLRHLEKLRVNNSESRYELYFMLDFRLDVIVNCYFKNASVLTVISLFF